MQASRDENNVTTLIALSNLDGFTPIRVKAKNGNLRVNIGSAGSDNGGGNIASRDENQVTVLIAASSVDGITPVQIYTTPDGRLLLDNS